MEIRKTTISLTPSTNAEHTGFITGEKIKAHVLQNLGNGFYLVNLKGNEVKVKSYVPLKDNEIFIVEKTLPFLLSAENSLRASFLSFSFFESKKIS